MQFKPQQSAVSLGIAIGFYILFLLSVGIFVLKGITEQDPLFEESSDYVLLAIPLGIQLIGGSVALYFYFSSKRS